MLIGIVTIFFFVKGDSSKAIVSRDDSHRNSTVARHTVNSEENKKNDASQPVRVPEKALGRGENAPFSIASAQSSPASTNNDALRQGKIRRYGPFFNGLNLTAEQRTRIIDLLIEKDRVRSDFQQAVKTYNIDERAAINKLRTELYSPIISEMREILGEEYYMEYSKYERTSAYRISMIDPINDSFASQGVGMTEIQKSRLIEILVKNNKPRPASPTDVSMRSNFDWDAIVRESEAILNPRQVAALVSEIQRRSTTN